MSENAENVVDTVENSDESQEGPRDLNVLLGLSYSEMTEEEIELVVDFRAEVKARDSAFQERHEQRLAYLETVALKWLDVAEGARAELDAQVQAANDRLAKAIAESEVG